MRVALVLDRRGEGAREVVGRAQKPRLNDLKNRPVLHEAVFNGRTRHRDHLRGMDRAHGNALIGGGVLDGLRLIEHQKPPAAGAENFGVAPQCAVGGERDVGHLLSLGEAAPGAVIKPHREPRRKPGDLAHPVREKGRWNNRERLALFGVELALFLERRDGGNHLKGLPQAHVVGNKGTDAERQVLHEPGVAACLIGAKPGLQSHGRRDVGHLRQGLQALANVVRSNHLGALVFAREEGAHLLEIRGLRLASDGIGQVRKRLGIEVDEILAKAHDFACMCGKRIELLLRERFVAQRGMPVETRDGVLVEKTLLRPGGLRDRGDKPRREDAFQGLRQHDRDAKHHQHRRRVKEKVLQLARLKRHGLAAGAGDAGEHRAGLGQGLDDV